MAAVTHVHDCDVQRRVDPDAAEGDFRDTHLDDSWPDAPFGDENSNLVGAFYGGKEDTEFYQGLLYFDLNAFIPAGATITAARWWFNVMSGSFPTPDATYRVRRCSRADWVEMEATWNIYKTGSNWTNPGGDFTTPTINFGAIDSTGWKNYDVLTMISDAWDNRSGICTFGFDRYGSLEPTGWFSWGAKDRYSGFGDALIHHLRVTYTLDGRTFQALVFDDEVAAEEALRRRLAQMI